MKLKLLTILLVILGISIYMIPKKIINDSKTNLENIEQEKVIEEKIEKEVMINESSNEPITNNKQDNNKNSGISSNSTSDTNKDDKKSNTNINSNVVEENKVESNSNPIENSSNNVGNDSTQVENSSTSKVEKQYPWDDLGITEYEYYNKPMWSWARVDYSIKEYGTQELTQEACINEGNNMLDDILSFSCTSINSYSGDYLGEMLRVKY